MYNMGSWKRKIEYEARKNALFTDPLLNKSHRHKELIDEIDAPSVCPKCFGYGGLPSGHTNENVECPECEGTGEIW